ncbi:MAG: outer membrane protein assembly factor BamB [Rhodoferax sp.]
MSVVLRRGAGAWWRGLAQGCAAAALALLAACSSAPEKPQPSPLAPDPGLLPIRTAWTAHIGEAGYGLVPTASGAHVALAGADGTVAVIDARTGGDLWRVRLDKAVTAGVGYDGRFAAVVTADQQLVVIESGQVLWRAPLGAAAFTAPLVAGQRVFAVAADRTVYAWDAATGRPLWQQPRGADSLVLRRPGLLGAVQDTLVVGTAGRVLGLNPNTGAVRWEAPVATGRGSNEVEKLVDVVAGVARAGQQLCVRAYQSAIGCIDAEKGVRLWSKPSVGFVGVHGDGTVLAGADAQGVVTAYQHASGEVLWSTRELRYRALTAVQMVGRSVVVGDAQGHLHFFSKQDGALLTRLDSDGSAIAASPLLVERTLVVVTEKGLVLGLRPE